MEAFTPHDTLSYTLYGIPLLFAILAGIYVYYHRELFPKIFLATLINAYLSLFISGLFLTLVKTYLNAMSINLDDTPLGENSRFVIFICTNIALSLALMRRHLKKHFNCEEWTPTLIFGGLASTIYFVASVIIVYSILLISALPQSVPFLRALMIF